MSSNKLRLQTKWTTALFIINWNLKLSNQTIVVHHFLSDPLGSCHLLSSPVISCHLLLSPFECYYWSFYITWLIIILLQFCTLLINCWSFIVQHLRSAIIQLIKIHYNFYKKYVFKFVFSHFFFLNLYFLKIKKTYIIYWNYIYFISLLQIKKCISFT